MGAPRPLAEVLAFSPGPSRASGLGLEWPAAGGLDQGLGVLGWRVVTSRLPLGSSSGAERPGSSCSFPAPAPTPAGHRTPPRQGGLDLPRGSRRSGVPGLKLASSAPSSLCPSPEDWGGRGVGVGTPSTAPAAVARCARVWSKRLTHGGAASGLHGEALSPRGLPCGGRARDRGAEGGPAGRNSLT